MLGQERLFSRAAGSAAGVLSDFCCLELEVVHNTALGRHPQDSAVRGRSKFIATLSSIFKL